MKVLSDALKRAKSSHAKTQRQKAALEKSIAKTEMDQAIQLTKRGKQLEGRRGRLSLSSVYSIGLRRCCTSIAAADFSVVPLMDLSRSRLASSNLIWRKSLRRS